jgi:hypothetical protein
LAINDDAMNAVTQVLNALVDQLVDTNTALADISTHVTFLSMGTGRIGDELETLNAAIGRIEDHISYRP